MSDMNTRTEIAYKQNPIFDESSYSRFFLLQVITQFHEFVKLQESLIHAWKQFLDLYDAQIWKKKNTSTA